MGLMKITAVGCLLGLLFVSITTAADEDVSEGFKIPEIIPDIPYDRKTSQLVAQSVMNFAHNLAVALDTDEYPNTQIFSPLSVMSALSILEMGSYGNSFKQLNQLFAPLFPEHGTNSSKIHEEFGWLLVDTMRDGKPPRRSRPNVEWRSKPFNNHGFSRGQVNDLDDQKIHVSNALFVQNGFSLRPNYAYAAQSVYRSEVTTLDFRHNPDQSKHYINSWVKQNTLGIIPTLIDDELSSDTKMVLASTLYFKGFWENVFFDTTGKQKEAFYPDGPDSYPVGVTFMGVGGSFPFYDSKEHNCRIIGLPYRGNQTTMYVIQPNDSTRLVLQQLQKNLTGAIINELISKMEYRTATLAFPKFHVQSKMHLKAPLKRMGIEDIFINGQSDLALIADPEDDSSTATKAFPSSSFAANPVPIPEELETASEKTRPSLITKLSPLLPISEAYDRFGDAPLLFSRFGEESNNETTATDRPEQTTDKDELVETTTSVDEENFTSIEIESATEKMDPEEKPSSRSRRETTPISPSAKSLQRLDEMRATPGLKNPGLYVDEIVHKIDFNVNEQGTEAAAASAGYLLKTGPNVSMRLETPFLILVRHDPTELPLFYGVVNIPF